MIDNHYILDGHTPVACGPMTWARWFQTHRDERRVARTEKGDVSVSTVFLGLNHQYGDGPPLIFETMIFGGESDEWQDRCSTWEQAEEMHARACRLAFGEIP